MFVIAIFALLTAAVVEGRQNLAAQGITTGFSFLERSTGFDVGFRLIDYGGYSSYARLLLVGLLNTLLMGTLGILAANLVGLIIAILRISGNSILEAIGVVYTELFRNIPMILQVIFWYMLLLQLPPPRQAFQGLGTILSSRGAYVPALNVNTDHAVIAIAVAVAGLLALLVTAVSRGLSRHAAIRRIRWSLALATLVAATVTLWLGRIPETQLISWPELQGLNIRGGMRLQPEFVALLFGMAIYGGAYIAEIIRAGFISVGRGQIEAARSLGLTPLQVFSRVQLPLAIRAVLPSLINLYVWLFKATTLGVVVGFTDFFAVISVSINQAGQTLELIGILMLTFVLINNSLAFVLNRVNKAIALKGSHLRS
ncbi:ABC transporter permease subunit [Palleronia sp. KMU-117]|uniref:ABC transporter permease subunit n=1 Tax=Palleronia sp. KMU-117 TaxID=3434108 RepID=UPI003D7413D0